MPSSLLPAAFLFPSQCAAELGRRNANRIESTAKPLGAKQAIYDVITYKYVKCNRRSGVIYSLGEMNRARDEWRRVPIDRALFFISFTFLLFEEFHRDICVTFFCFLKRFQKYLPVSEKTFLRCFFVVVVFLLTSPTFFIYVSGTLMTCGNHEAPGNTRASLFAF